MSTTSEIHVATTAFLQVSGLKDRNGNVDNGATVTLEDLVEYVEGTQVSGLTYPVTIPYIAASAGVYELTLPPTLGVTAKKAYIATIKAVGSGGDVKQWKETIRCKDAAA